MEMTTKQKYDWVRKTAGYRLNKHKIDLFFKDINLALVPDETELKSILERWLMGRFRTAKKFVDVITIVDEGPRDSYLCLDVQGKTYVTKDHNELMDLDLRNARYANSSV